MTKEPFSRFGEKLLHYKQLEIEESIDHEWKRDRKLDAKSLASSFQQQMNFCRKWQALD